MAADLNTVSLVGRLTRDPESRGGAAVTAMRVAFTTRSKQGEEWVDKSNYLDVVCFGRTAEHAFQYLTKGRRAGFVGRLEWREWDDKDGNKRQTIELVAQDVFFLDSREDGGRQAAQDMPVDTRGMKPAVDDLDVPF